MLRHAKPPEITKMEQNPEENQSPNTDSSAIIFMAISEHNHLLSFLVEVQLLKKPRLSGES